jgi:hypothetical protein
MALLLLSKSYMRSCWAYGFKLTSVRSDFYRFFSAFHVVLSTARLCRRAESTLGSKISHNPQLVRGPPSELIHRVVLYLHNTGQVHNPVQLKLFHHQTVWISINSGTKDIGTAIIAAICDHKVLLRIFCSKSRDPVLMHFLLCRVGY